MKEIELYNGINLPNIGYGTFPLKNELINTIPQALECGYKLFDTSDDYFNMRYMTEAFENDVIISTKISRPTEIFKLKNNFEKWKEENGIPKDRIIDILLMHFPYPYFYCELWEVMEELYLQGKCKVIGVCNFEIEHLKKLMCKCRIKPMINQFELHPLFRQDELCKYCKKNNITIMSYSPVARMNKSLIENDYLKKLSIKYKKTIPQIIIRWNVQHGYIPLPASASNEHIKQNIDVFDFTLLENEMNKIDDIDSGNRIRYDPKKFYGKKGKIQDILLKIVYRIIRHI